MSLEAVASLIIATFDLSVVKSIRGAIHAADEASGKQFPVTAIGPSPNPLIRGVLGQNRTSDNNRPVALRPAAHAYRVTPEPRIEPRRIIHPTPRVEHACNDAPLPSPAPECPRGHSPIEPPWKVLPWSDRYRVDAHDPAGTIAAAKIKHLVRRVDVADKGTIIDMFL